MKSCNKLLLGHVFDKTINYSIIIDEINKEIPFILLNDFSTWLHFKGLELGSGEHYEPYPIDHLCKNDIFVKFTVTFK